jgi:transposase
MNYTQNQKIMQVKNSTLVVGIDIAKEIHVARAQDYRGLEYSKAIKIKNNSFGFESFKNWLDLMMDEYEKAEVIIGMEPTGHYWLNLEAYLREAGFKVVLVNPAHVKKSKSLDDNTPSKSDKKDARVIAQLVKDGRYSEPNMLERVYAELRSAMTHRERLNNDLGRIKAKIQQTIDKYFPEFFKCFKKWNGKAALSVLNEIPFPVDIKDLRVEDIVVIFKKGAKRAVGKKKAAKLKLLAQRSVGITDGMEMARLELSNLIAQYELINKQKENLETTVIEKLKKIPGAKEMLSIKGVGEMTVAGFISEVGDINNYSHPKQVQKLAGLNLVENSSGKHKGKTTISKRGRPFLRSTLYRVTLPLVAKNDEFKMLHAYYTTRAENPLKKKQSLIVIACKLIRVLYALGTKQIEYDGQKLLNDMLRDQDIDDVA